MDLELKFDEITSFASAGDLVVTHEESMETAIPEYCPDIARIVDTAGQINLREKSISDGRLTISGAVKMTVLYTSEEGAGLRSLALSVPFTCSVEDKRDCQVVCVEGKLLLLEAKMLSSRKLYVHVMPEFHVRGFCKTVSRLCTDVDPSQPSLQIRRESAALPLITDVWEREFNFAQEVLPEEGRESAEDLLMDRGTLRVTGVQQIGSKLVVKGEAFISALYRAESQRLCRQEMTLPFSQIIDGEDLPEDGSFFVTACPLEREVHLVRTEAGTGFGVTMRIGLIIQTYALCRIDYVADLYSTKFHTAAQQEAVAFATAQMPEELHRDTVEHLEGVGDFAYLTSLDCGQPEVTEEGSKALIRTPVRTKVLYLDEAGTPVVAERSTQVQADAGRLPSAVQACCEMESWQRNGGGYEVRLPVALTLQHSREEKVMAIISAQLQEEIDRTAQPSLILRRLRDGETLWDVAKQCQTEQQAIMAANGLSEGERMEDTLLLIPKTR